MAVAVEALDRRVLYRAVHSLDLAAVRENNPPDCFLIFMSPRMVELGHSAVNGQMQLVIRDSTQFLTDSDLTAMATYLVSLNPPMAKPAMKTPTETEKLLVSADPSMALGPRLYLDNCSACHFANGLGANGVTPTSW